MKKRISLMLTLCLAVCGGAGIAQAEETAAMAVTPTLLFDGTILRVEIAAAPPAGAALVESGLLSPDAAGDPQVVEAVSTGATLMGVRADVSVHAGNAKLPNLRAQYGGQNGGAMTKGFLYVLTPDAPKDGLTVQAQTELVAEDGGEALDTYSETLPVPAAIPANTASFPVNIAMGGAKIERVYISSSTEAFCVFLRCDGGTRSEARLDSGGGGMETRFTLDEMRNSSAMRWSMYVFDPIGAQGALPGKINLTLSGFTGAANELAGTLEIDIAGQSARVL